MNEPNVPRPPVTLYEVRTCHSEAYWAEGDVIEHEDRWFTLWGDEHTVALRIPEADIRAVRQVDPADAVVDAQLTAAVHRTLGIDLSSGTPDVASALSAACRELAEARSEARGWEEKYFEMVKARTAMAERVLALPGRPEVENASDPSSEDYLRGYRHATDIAKRALENPRATADRERP